MLILKVRTAYQGALTTIYVAVAPEAADVTEKFWATCGVTPSSKESYDLKAQEIMGHKC